MISPLRFVLQRALYQLREKERKRVTNRRNNLVQRTKEELISLISSIDGKGYKAYSELEGAYDFGSFILFVDHVQPDPFAPPSRLRARVSQRLASFPKQLYANKIRRMALEDFLTRAFGRASQRVSRRRGTGFGGMIFIDVPGQEVLERTSMVVCEDFVEARFMVSLPASGRRVLGKEAIEIFLEDIPYIVEASLLFSSIDHVSLKKHVDVVEDQEVLRSALREKGLVAFIGNGSILPRESGVSDKPMSKEKAIPFISPPSLEVEFDLPNSGKVRGMGIREGVTLIVGGGYHGKSTLLRALERGVYPHIPGDGREFVVSLRETVKIRAEDGRSVEKVDISPFISCLPMGRDTRAFSTDDASGSTSQAANIMEALEMGAKVLLIDEDTSATNFMIRDARMQALVPKDKEPITPFIDKVRSLYRDHGVSSVIVLGGSGDYFDVADHVIMMDEYRPVDVTLRAKEIAQRFSVRRRVEGGESFGDMVERIPIPSSIDPRKGGKRKVKAKGLRIIEFGKEVIDLSHLEQLVDESQTKAIGDLMCYGVLKGYIDGRATLREIIDRIMKDIDEYGLDCLSPFRGEHPGEYALPRVFEIAGAFNRLRSLKVMQKR